MNPNENKDTEECALNKISWAALMMMSKIEGKRSEARLRNADKIFKNRIPIKESIKETMEGELFND